MHPSSALRSGGDSPLGKYGKCVQIPASLASPAAYRYIPEFLANLARSLSFVLYRYYTGQWGNMGSPTQKGTISFGLSANRQNPFAGALNDAIFNTWRRFSGKVLYIAPPMVFGYFLMDWAIKK